MPHVLIAGPIHADGMAVLETRDGVTIEVLAAPDADQLAERLADADALLIRTAPLSAAAVAAAPRLKVVARHGVGYDNVPVDALNARGIPLAIVGNVNAQTVAEHTLFLMLALAKRGPSRDRAARDGRWNAARGEGGTWELAGRTLLLVGFGRIGREVARRAGAFDMTVLAYDPFVDEAAMAALGVGKVDDWRAALPRADVVSLHVPRTPETENMIAAAELGAMKPTAVVINAARGGLIDETALAAALQAGTIAGAGLDTLDREPPGTDHPLLALDGVVFSPHSAALTEECLSRMGVSAAENILAGLDGRLDPALVVNREVLQPTKEKALGETS